MGRSVGKRGKNTSKYRATGSGPPVDSITFDDILTDYERDLLKNLHAELRPIGLTLHEKLNERDLRTIGLVLVAIGKRLERIADSGSMDWEAGKWLKRLEKKDDRILWALGDWLNYVDKSYSIEQATIWLNESIIAEDYRTHILELAGATLIQVQSAEHLIKLSCGLVGVENRGKRFTYQDLLSPDPKRRRRTLGWLKEGLKQRKDVTGSQIFTPAFESRLDQFVIDRNTFIHSLWADSFSDPVMWTHPPSIDGLRSIEEFLSQLLRQAHSLMAPFFGLVYATGKATSETEGFRISEISRFQRYEKDFLEARATQGTSGMHDNRSE